MHTRRSAKYVDTKTENFGYLPEGLQISCRRYKDTTLENNEKAKKSYEDAQNILKQIEEN